MADNIPFATSPLTSVVFHSGFIDIASGQTGVLATMTPSEGNAIAINWITAGAATAQAGISIKKDGVAVVDQSLLLESNPSGADRTGGAFSISGVNPSSPSMVFKKNEVITIEKNAGNTTQEIDFSYSEVAS